MPKKSGFTLIELLVVISILAILAIIGVTLFSSTQSKARDAKRKADITAMSKAMEVNYVVGTGYQTTISAAWFSDGVIPSNPAPGGAAYATNTPTTSAYVFCAFLENQTGNSSISTGINGTVGFWYCKKNQQ